MQTVTIGETEFQFRLNYTSRERLRSRKDDSEFGGDLDVTTIIADGSRVAELLATSVDYLVDVSCDLLINQEQRDDLRQKIDGDSMEAVYSAVRDEIVLFSQPPRRAALKAILNQLETEMAREMTNLDEPEKSPVLKTSTGNDGASLEPSANVTPDTVPSEN